MLFSGPILFKPHLVREVTWETVSWRWLNVFLDVRGLFLSISDEFTGWKNKHLPWLGSHWSNKRQRNVWSKSLIESLSILSQIAYFTIHIMLKDRLYMYVQFLLSSAYRNIAGGWHDVMTLTWHHCWWEGPHLVLCRGGSRICGTPLHRHELFLCSEVTQTRGALIDSQLG